MQEQQQVTDSQESIPSSDNAQEPKTETKTEMHQSTESTHTKKSFGDVKAQIQDIKNKLNAINTEKEQWFAKRNDFSQQIKAEIGKIKESAKSRDTLTSSVQEVKKRRDELNKQIAEKIKVAKTMQGSVQKTTQEKEGSSKPYINAEELRRQIAGMEKKIETEGLTFEKEKELMKKIKSIKKQYDEAKKVSESWGKSRELSKEISTLKKEANEKHQAIQETARESQKQHETLVTESKKIDELRKGEKEAHEKFMELKSQFNELNSQLKALLPEMKEAHDVREAEWQKKHKYSEEQKNKTLAERAHSVEQKLKAGGKKNKLTMEDLLAYQGMKE